MMGQGKPRRHESAARARARSYQATVLTIAILVSAVGGGLVLLGAPPWIIVFLFAGGIALGVWIQSRRRPARPEDEQST